MNGVSSKTPTKSPRPAAQPADLQPVLGSNATKSTPVLTADLLGDWREEIIWREMSNAALRVYTTTDVTTRRIYTLMHDPTYRAQVAFEQSGYNQPPHTGFRISPQYG